MQFSNEIAARMEKIELLQREHKERTLAEIIEKYDFVVGSIECKIRLMEVLSEGANIICSPYVENSTTVYAIKKFEITDLLMKPYEVEN